MSAEAGSPTGGGIEIELVEPDGSTRRRLVTGPTEIGREGAGIVIADPSASRRHLLVEPLPGGSHLGVTDLGSSYGTFVNGQRLDGPVAVSSADEIVLGGTRIRIATGAAAIVTPGSQDVVAPPPPPDPGPVTPAPVAPVTPMVPSESTIERDGIEVHYRTGSPGEAVAGTVLAAARRARRRLAGFGTEAMGGRVRIRLVDPFADPADPQRLVTGGTVLDVENAEVWLVVTAEAPPEPVGRALGLIFASSLPAAAELDWLIAGYATAVTVQPEVDRELGDQSLPPLARADGELGAMMATSFAAYLLRTGNEADVRRLLVEARPGRVDAAATAVFGATLAQLETRWRSQLGRSGASGASLLGFVRLSLQYLRPHRRRQVEIFALMLIGLAFSVVLPFATRRLLDTAIPSGQMSQVMGLLGMLLVVFAISLLADLRRSYVSGYVSGAIIRDLRDRMFERLQVLPTTWYRSLPQGDVLTRLFSDVAVVEQGLSSTIREGVFQVISMVVAAVVMIRLSPLLAVVVLVGAPAVAVVYRWMGEGARRRSTEVQERTGAMVEVAAENHGAEQLVKVFQLEGRELGRFREASGRLFRAERRMSLFGGLFGLVVNGFMTILRLGVLALGSWLVIRGRITIGTLVAFLGVMGEAVGPVTTLTTIGQNLQASSGALARIQEILSAPGEPAMTGPALPPLRDAVRFEGVRFDYGTGRSALDGVDLVIPKGRRVALVGPSGSGKSTVLRLLMGLHQPDEGRLAWDGVDLTTVGPGAIRQRLGVVFQDSLLFDTSLRENIALANPAASRDDVETAARDAELDSVVAALPGGLDAAVGPGGANLSGGQRQRVAIARALVRRPDILVLDEATSALDPQTERALAQTLDRVGRGRTTVSVTHRLASVVDFDCIYVVDGGRIVESGRHPELVTAGGVYAQLWTEQTGGPPATFGPPVDPVQVLSRTAPFDRLDQVSLASLVGRMVETNLPDGESVAEHPGRVYLVLGGRAELVQDGAVGRVVAAELRPGDLFGLAALLGEPTGARLRAAGRLRLAALHEDDLAFAFEEVDELRRALAEPPAPVRPSSSRRLARLTMSMTATGTPQETGPAPVAPGADW